MAARTRRMASLTSKMVAPIYMELFDIILALEFFGMDKSTLFSCGTPLRNRCPLYDLDERQTLHPRN